MTPRELIGQWVRALLGGLIGEGVRHAVISPGSRNTPLVFEALRRPELTCHSIIDERAASFFALGLSKTTGFPPVLICTSGSAGAHYLPAMMEATEAGLALIALTADRPRHLLQRGSPQTSDQTSLLGKFAREIGPLPEADARAESIESAIRFARQSVALALQEARPTHLNVPLAKPLEPEAAHSPDGIELKQLTTRLLKEGPLMRAAALQLSLRSLKELDTFLEGSEQKALILSSTDPALLTDCEHLAKRYGLRFLSELGAANSLNAEALRWLAENNNPPAEILHVGGPCLSAAYLKFLEEKKPRLSVLPGARYRQPASCDAKIYPAALPEALAQLISRRPSHSQEHSPVERLRGKAPSSPTHLGDDNFVRCLIESTPAQGQVILANSLAIRFACQSGARLQPGVTLHTSRGVNGIDGTVATACGVAAGTGKPTLLVVGDVALAHDLTSMSLLTRTPTPLLVALLDNGGGRIFDRLPARLALRPTAQEWEFWKTPPRIDWKHAAQAYHIDFEEPKSIKELTRLLQDWPNRGSSTLMRLELDEAQALEFSRFQGSSA